MIQDLSNSNSNSNPSQEFQRLAEAIHLLKAELLPPDLESDDFPVVYSQQSSEDLSHLSTKAKAFIALSHAEIEEYIENRATSIESNALSVWERQRKVGISLLSLMIFFPKRKDKKTTEFSSNLPRNTLVEKLKNYSYLDSEIKEVNTLFRQRVKNNHGIRSANLYSLLIPIGLKIDVFDELWIQEVESLADDRGQIVHKSRHGISQPINPRDKFEQVYKILYGRDSTDRIVFKSLIDIDKELDQLLL